MKKKYIAVFSVLLILVFIGYIVFDTIRSGRSSQPDTTSADTLSMPEAWSITREFKVDEGKLKAVAVSRHGDIYLGGDSFISCYNRELQLKWTIKTVFAVTALSEYGDSIYASSQDLIHILNAKGKILDEWGPFEDNSLITSVTSNRSFVAFADAGNKMVFILDKKGEVKKMTGQGDDQFIVPSPYFDVSLDSINTLFVANTGKRRIETRDTQCALKSYFGEPGTAPDAFCGCCNPAHFFLLPNGFVTSEKGINRIKILNKSGKFVEFVSLGKNFTPSVPLDLASADGKTIYGANPADSKLYVFKHN